jgi:hypothetical protein
VPGIALLTIVPLLSAPKGLHRKALSVFSTSTANFCIDLFAGLFEK